MIIFLHILFHLLVTAAGVLMIVFGVLNDNTPLWIWGIVVVVAGNLAAYLRMIYFDVVFNNVDRHNENCGLLRDKRNGKIIALAPNFDDNLSLISKTNKLNVSKDEGFLKYFMEYLDKHRIVKDAFKTVNIKIFSRNEVRKLCEEIDINVDINMIVDFIDIHSRTLLEYLGKTRELSIEELQEPIN